MNAINKNEVSMFKVGDKVVYLSKIAPEHDDIYEIYHLSEDSCFMSHLGFDYKAMFEYIRHVTPEEIAADHRIYQSIITVSEGKTDSLEVLRDCDTPPNCKKFEEQVVSNDWI
ncbi:hypothetical protein [Acinetobacter haemolyticus]|uniref:hypothetical protein n=1 Tax=Acinetobacter haemolyticus TaxID=29430 RepID=UPI0024DE8B14|nr:hypothetical protein [Acinetobacter haemolyticus]